MTAILKTLNPYSPRHKTKLNKVTKAINTLHADLLITRDSTRNLFRANMEREVRKKKKSTGGYIPAFGRVLTEAEATRHREDEAKKVELATQKKEAAEARKLAVATRRADDEMRRRAKRAEKEEKRRLRDEAKAMKAAEVVDRKRKREEVRHQKELDRINRPKRQYRRRLAESSNQETTQPFPVDPALEMQSTEARSPTPALGGYEYPQW